MLMKRRTAAVKVAHELFALEKAIDVALVKAAQLNALMPVATAEAELSCIVIQDAIDRSAATFAALAQARRHVVDTHHCLDATKVQIGLRTLNFGNEPGKPPPPGGMLTEVERRDREAA